MSQVDYGLIAVVAGITAFVSAFASELAKYLISQAKTRHKQIVEKLNGKGGD